jgi:hypothetical protein
VFRHSGFGGSLGAFRSCKKEGAEKMKQTTNKITGANAGAPPQLAMRALLAARVAQFWRST